MIRLDHYSLLPVFVVGLIVILAFIEIGRRLGMRAAGEGGDNVTTLTGAILGLLALMISFTFAIALSRFEARREAILAEANAIGTAALRARLLPAPYNAESRKLLQEYVQVRLDVTQHVPSPAQLDAAIERSNALQSALWQQAKTVAAKENRMMPTGLFVEALNQMIDNQEKRLTAMRNRVPNIVLVALWGVAAIAAAFVGYHNGMEIRRSRLPVYVTGMLISAVILLVQELDRPGALVFAISQQPMLDTAASIAASPD